MSEVTYIVYRNGFQRPGKIDAIRKVASQSKSTPVNAFSYEILAYDL
jgi:hypothetical protein